LGGWSGLKSSRPKSYKEAAGEVRGEGIELTFRSDLVRHDEEQTCDMVGFRIAGTNVWRWERGEKAGQSKTSGRVGVAVQEQRANGR